MILPYGRQTIDRADVRAVLAALGAERITQGPAVERFEEKFARAVGAPYAVAVSSGTAGLHLAALAAGLGPGDEAVVPPLTFVATANCVVYAGARPRFADVDPDTFCLTAASAARRTGKRTKAVLPVHFAGHPAGGRFPRGLAVIEDACHALGAETVSRGIRRKVGSCEGSDMAVFSFHPVKHVTTGEGGMVTTRRRDLYEKLRLLRSHGIERDPKRFVRRGEAGNPWYYEMTALGFNYRITDVQCALGASQLDKLESFVARRREIAAYYSKRLAGLDAVRLPSEAPGCRSSWHLYVLRVDFKATGKTRAAAMRELAKLGVGTQVHYIPVTRQPYYMETYGTRPEDYPVTEAFYAAALSIPMFPAMTRADADRVVRAVQRTFKKGR